MSVKDDILKKEELQKVEQGRNTRIQPVQNMAQTTTTTQAIPQQATNNIVTDTSQGNDAIKRMWDFVNSLKPNQEQIEQENKKQRQRALISAIGDGISAIANMYYTSKGAPSMFNPSNSLTAQNQKRWEAIKKERDANKDRYNAAYMRALQLEDANYKSERSWQNTINQQNITQAWRERQAAIAEEKAKQQQENWQKTFNATEEHRRTIEANNSNKVGNKSRTFTVDFNDKKYDKDAWGLREAANDALALYPELYPTEGTSKHKKRKDNLTTDDFHNIINKANDKKKQGTPYKEVYPLREIYEYGEKLAKSKNKSPLNNKTSSW